MTRLDDALTPLVGDGNIPRPLERLGIRVSTEESGLVITRTEPHVTGIPMIPKVAHFVSYKLFS
jgi:hypothetical protein